MMQALFTAATGMEAQQLNLDVISNNLANVSTTGYKDQRADFEDILSQVVVPPGIQQAQGDQTPTGISIGLGVRPGATQHIFSQGNLESTSNPLDLAIEGNGFFQVTLPDGTIAYTRDGTFKMDDTGRLVTSDGYPLSPEIVIPQNATSVSIGQDGTVSAVIQGSAAPQILGQITLANFINPAGLTDMGQNLYLQTQASGAPIIGDAGTDGLGQIQQGYTESSNVNATQELINMIIAQQAFEYNSKSITTADTMLSDAAALITP